MFSRNRIIDGVLIGLIAPALAFALAWLLRGNLYLMNKPGAPYFAAIIINLVFMRGLVKKEVPNTIRGIMICTFVFMVVVFLTVIKPIR
jgi:hypothetical protein